MIWFRVLLLLLGCVSAFDASIAQAQYSNGTVDGYYTYRDGYWWYSGYPYTRVAQQYSYCGRYYTRWVYSQYFAPQVTLSSSDPDYRNKLIELVMQQKQYENKLRASANKHNEFMEEMIGLGINGSLATTPLVGGVRLATGVPFAGAAGYNPGANAYGSLTITSNGSLAYVPNAQQGQTVYGYQEAVRADPVLDLNSVFNQADQHTINAQALGGQAREGFAAITDRVAQQKLANDARKMEIVEKAKAMALVGAQLNPSATVQQNSTTYQYSNKQSTQAQQPNQPNQPATPPKQQNKVSRLVNTLQTYCTACHNPQKAEKNLDLTKYFSFSPEQKELVRTKLNHPDPTKRMPLKEDGTSGNPLPEELKSDFYDN